MKRLTWILLGALFCGRVSAAELPEITEEAITELGLTPGTPQMNGFVFIDGRYIPPPYTVTRKGNGIFVNRILIEQVPLGVLAAAETAAAAEQTPAKKSVDADGDFVEVKAEADVKPADEASPEAVAEPAKPKTVKSIADLFADSDVPEKPMPAAVPAPVAAAEAARPVVVAPVMNELTPEDSQRQKEAFVASLERLRKGYDQALIQGEFFFFGQRHNRVNGNYGTARMLMEVLPKALRYAQSPQDLLQRLNQGNVYFVDLGICTALYKNKFTFPQLEERLQKIEEAEAVDSMKRKPAPRW